MSPDHPIILELMEESRHLNGTHMEPGRTDLWLKVVVMVFCALLASVGAVMNGFIVVSMIFHGVVHSTTNRFILTLTISDIVLCSFIIPFQLAYDLFQLPVDSSAVCKVVFSFFGVPMYVSCLIIMCIAIDRHRIVFHQMNTSAPLPQKAWKIWLIVAGIVLLSVLNASPVGWYSYSEAKRCLEVWSSPHWQFFYSIYVYVCQFVLPLSTSLVLYARIYHRLAQRRSFRRRGEEEKKQRTNRILISVVTCFAVFWMPWCTLGLLQEILFYLEHLDCKMKYRALFRIPVPVKMWRLHIQWVDIALRLFVMFSACVNPFLYGWLNKPIRDVMLRCLPGCCKSIQPTETMTTDTVKMRSEVNMGHLPLMAPLSNNNYNNYNNNNNHNNDDNDNNIDQHQPHNVQGSSRYESVHPEGIEVVTYPLINTPPAVEECSSNVAAIDSDFTAVINATGQSPAVVIPIVLKQN